MSVYSSVLSTVHIQKSERIDAIHLKLMQKMELMQFR